MPGYRVEPTIFQSGTPLEKFRCPICELLLRDAVQPSCGHWLCQTCAEELFARESPPRCPRKDCGDNLTPEEGANYFPDRFVRREILSLDVVCEYMTKGCNWKGKFSNLEAHLMTCVYNFSECNHCHQNFAASEMDAHLSVCPKAPQSCPLIPLGCKEPGKIPDLQLHLTENLAGHVTMLTSKVMQLSDSVQKLELRKQELPLQRMEADGGCSTDDGYTSLPDRNNDVIESDGKLQALGGPPKESLYSVGDLTPQQVYSYSDERHYRDGKDTENLPLKPKKGFVADVGPPNFDVMGQRSYDDSMQQITRMMQKEIARAKEELEGSFKNELRKRDDEITTLRTSNAKLEKLLRAKSAEIEDRDFRLSLIENSNHDGSMIWKIPQFSQRMNDAQSGKYTSIFSLPFYTGRYGYKMCLRLYILGDGIGKNSHMSLFFVIMRGEFDNILQWPFTHKVTFKLVNQTGARDVIDTFQPDPMSSSFRKPKSDMNVASGCPRFVAHQELKNGGFIVDDTIFIKCIIDRTTMRNP